MAVEQQNSRTGNIFTEHPRALGMTWASHGTGAVKIGAELIGAGTACIIHETDRDKLREKRDRARSAYDKAMEAWRS